MATAQYGSLLWGDGQYGAADVVVPWTASGVLTMNASGSLSTGIPLTTSVSLTLAGAASVTTGILMQASAVLELLGTVSAGGFRVARNARVLSKCGHPLSTAEGEWLTK